MSALTQTLSPDCTWLLPDARARIFSVKVIRKPVYSTAKATATRDSELAICQVATLQRVRSSPDIRELKTGQDGHHLKFHASVAYFSRISRSRSVRGTS